MSWDASLSAVTEVTHCPDCGHELEKPRREKSEIGWWNYTHNTSRMIYDALAGAGIELTEDESWWRRLCGMCGTEGRDYLAAIVRQLECDAPRYRAMNPPNGWGSYDGPHGLLAVLREMRDAVPEDVASEWHASG